MGGLIEAAPFFARFGGAVRFNGPVIGRIRRICADLISENRSDPPKIRGRFSRQHKFKRLRAVRLDGLSPGLFCIIAAKPKQASDNELKVASR